MILFSNVCMSVVFLVFRDNAPPSDEEMIEREKHEKLIGQLKFVLC